MSLTNPKDVVTEERLSEFYQGILPYLGGMPEMLANKFNRSDLYSETEKIVGQWIDGKPVYQRVVAPNDTYTSGTSTLVSNIINAWGIERVVKFDGILWRHDNNFVTPLSNSTSSSIDYIYINSDDNSLKLVKTTTSSNLWKVFVIIQYTKTSDTAQPIGVDTDYSTTEKIVGTWIDGKPLYQMTLDVPSIVASGTTTPANLLKLSDYSISTVAKADGYLIESGNYYYLPDARGRLIVRDGYLRLYSVDGGSWNGSGVITVQYTKTSN